MFIGVRQIDRNNTEFVEPVNVIHIIRVSFLDVKNTDAGVQLHMRNGDVIPSPEPMDVIAPKIEKAWSDACVLALTQIALEMSEMEVKTKRRRKK